MAGVNTSCVLVSVAVLVSVPVVLLSSAKAERELGATFRPLRETLQDEVNWFQRASATRFGAKSSA
jgi:hypothetical protein